jgi:hypothetical protein
MVSADVDIGRVLPPGTRWEFSEDVYRIALPRSDFSGKNLRFLGAEISRVFPYPLLRVIYEDIERDMYDGLRLDTGKRVFLDHFEDQHKELEAQEFAPKIAAYVAPAVLELLRVS